MSTKKVKKLEKIVPPASREAMETLVGEIAALAIERAAMTAELEDRLLNIRAEYEARLVENGAMQDAKMDAAFAWAAAHPELFGKTKSIEMVHGIVGYRTGTPKLKTLKGYTWDSVLAILQAAKRTEYIRLSAEVDKAKILADRETIPEADLRIMGVHIAQDETFFVEPKQEVSGQ
jgi:phage host-nuclease inhibitor protein Gam